MNQKLSKEIMNRSRIKRKYYREWSSKKNFLEVERIKNPCKNLTKNAKKRLLKSVSSKDTTTSKKEGFFQTKTFVQTILLK